MQSRRSTSEQRERPQQRAPTRPVYARRATERPARRNVSHEVVTEPYTEGGEPVDDQRRQHRDPQAGQPVRDLGGVSPGAPLETPDGEQPEAHAQAQAERQRGSLTGREADGLSGQ